MASTNPIEDGFQALSDLTGFPIDQIRYITLLFLSFPVAWVMRYALHPSHTSVTTRHVFSAGVGIAMGTICFGWEMFLLFGMVGVSYAMLWVVPPAFVQWYTMAWAMSCIIVAHFFRLLTDFGGYHLDFTGPLMILVQKVTLLAFALHDGMARKESDLNADQKLQKINVKPTVLEYISYTFNFHSLLAGPSITIQEHLQFMDGSNLRIPDNPNAYARAKEHVKEPSALYSVLSKLLSALMCLGAFVYLSPLYSIEAVLDPSFSFPYFLWRVHITAIKIRFQYYFIWYLVDSFSNAAGLGFSGYDKLGNAKWDTVTNIGFMAVEFAPNFRSAINAWNIRTALWLRRVCYERVKFSPNMMTFVLSAIWHGFYPGYYLCFVCGGFTNEAARKMRRLVRHYFQSSLPLKWGYDILTTLVTYVFLDFAGMTFIMMWLDKGLALWAHYYYLPLIIVVVITVFFPSGKGMPGKRKTEDAHTHNPSSNELKSD